MKTRFAMRAAGAALALGIVGLAGAAQAAQTGQDIVTPVLGSPGQDVTAVWTVKNTAPWGNYAPTGHNMVFDAPPNTTFTEQTTVPTKYSGDNGQTYGPNAFILTNCVRSASNTKLTCVGSSPSSPGGFGWGTNYIFRFEPQVRVSDTAPAGALLHSTTSTASLNRNDRAEIDTISGSLAVQVPGEVAVPVAEPVAIAGAAGLAAAGALLVARKRRTA
jgi:hypothetical protein